MSKIKVTVSKVSEKTSNGNYITTLKTEGTKVNILGTEVIGNGLTYFVALKGAPKVGAQDEIDLSKFDVVEREYTPEPDAETGEVAPTMMLKWLYPSRG
jgi:hypothetical protein